MMDYNYSFISHRDSCIPFILETASFMIYMSQWVMGHWK